MNARTGILISLIASIPVGIAINLITPLSQAYFSKFSARISNVIAASNHDLDLHVNAMIASPAYLELQRMELRGNYEGAKMGFLFSLFAIAVLLGNLYCAKRFGRPKAVVASPKEFTLMLSFFVAMGLGGSFYSMIKADGLSRQIKQAVTKRSLQELQGTELPKFLMPKE